MLNGEQHVNAFVLMVLSTLSDDVPKHHFVTFHKNRVTELWEVVKACIILCRQGEAWLWCRAVQEML